MLYMTAGFLVIVTLSMQHGVVSLSPKQASSSEAARHLRGRSQFLTSGRDNFQNGTIVVASTTWNASRYPTEHVLKSLSYDWLFHVQTTSCQGQFFDMTTDSLIARTFLPLLFAAILWAMTMTAFINHPHAPDTQKLLMDSKDAHSLSSLSPPVPIKSNTGSHDAEPAGTSGSTNRVRLWHLDFARICAIMCVVGEHSGGRGYTHRNVGFGLWWVLPYLYMTSGMGFMMSKSSMISYVSRLLLIFLVGVGANWVADIISNRDWKNDFGNTIYQMAFVLMLIGCAVVVEPLRMAFKNRTDSGNKRPTLFFLIAAACGGLLVLTSFGYFVAAKNFYDIHGNSNWLRYYAPLFNSMPLMIVQVGGTLVLAAFAVIMATPENTGYVGWLLLFWIYLPRLVVPWDHDAFPHYITLYIFALVVTNWPLRGTATIVKITRAYWPFLLMALCLNSMPDMWGRCDVHPPFSLWERMRMNFGEAILAICFVTGGFGPDDPYKITSWMNWWSLYAYCFHVMWYRLFGSPYAFIITFGTMVPFCLGNRLCKERDIPPVQDDNSQKIKDGNEVLTPTAMRKDGS